MMTIREARQRLMQSEMTLSRVGASEQFRVSFCEDGYRDAEKHSFYTDCLETAVITGSNMRRDRSIRLRRAI